MKLSQQMMKLIIKTLILMMLFVLMFMISSFLYSARYWPDVYNYINANITIKRIPTISELELTVMEVDYTTEMYTTTDVDYIYLSTTDDLDIDEFMKDEIDFKKKVKRNIVVEQLKDYIELPSRPIFVDYIFLEEPIKQDTSIPKDIANDNIVPKELDEDSNIFKTSVTGIVVEDQLQKTTVSEEPAVTKQYYTVQPPKSKESKRCVDEEPNTTDTTKMVTTDYFLEYSTTKEGYLVGDDPNLNIDEVTKEPVVITTKANENELVDDEQDSRLMRDLVDVSKLSTRGSEDVEMVTGKPEKLQIMPDPTCHGDLACKEFTKTVFPWVVSIFVTNNKDNQFSYFCDGALLAEKVIVTGARCMFVSNKTWNPDNVLVFLGKVNLQTFGGDEKVHKIKSIVTHPNFTMESDGKASKDLALIVLEEAVEFNENIQSACLHQDNSLEEAATTAWDLNGALMPIFFNKQRGENCFDKDEDVFCATYGNEIALCPSYGGLFASRQADRWCLTAIFYGDPTDRGICFTKDVHYTSLKNHFKWIDNTLGMYKNGCEPGDQHTGLDAVWTPALTNDRLTMTTLLL